MTDSTPDDVTDLGDLELKSFKYRIGGEPYTLREASADAAVKYRNASSAGATMKDGTVTVGRVGDVEPLLVSLCLFDQHGRAVPLHVVKTWPARITKALFTKIKEVSDLAEKETDAPKEAAARYGDQFYLADRLGMHLHDLMGWPGPMTYRQERAWLAWVREDMNRPGKTEHYLMDVSATVVRVNAKPGTRVSTDEFRLKFEDRVAPAPIGARPAVDPDHAKQFVIGGLGFGAGVTHKTRTRAEAIALGLLPPDDDGGAP